MGLFQSFKNKLGIGGVSVELQVPAQVDKSAGTMEGSIFLTTKSDQQLVKLSVKLVEEFTTGRGDEKKTKEFELGKMTQTLNDETIKTGDRKELKFSLPFQILKSNNDELKEKGGAMGAIGKMASFATNEKSEFYVVADVDVKSAALDPSDKKPIRLV